MGVNNTVYRKPPPPFFSAVARGRLYFSAPLVSWSLILFNDFLFCHNYDIVCFQIGSRNRVWQASLFSGGRVPGFSRELTEVEFGLGVSGSQRRLLVCVSDGNIFPPDEAQR